MGAAVWLCDITNADPGVARPSSHGLRQTRCPGLGLDVDSGLQMREAGTAAASGPRPSGSWAAQALAELLLCPRQSRRPQ